MRIRNGFAVAVTVAALAGLAVPASAATVSESPIQRPAAGTQLWGGSGSNDLGPATMLLSTRGGQVTLKSVQFIMACTDASDGTESDRAFDYVSGSATLHLNRFTMNLRGSSNGRDGAARITGVLGSNGRGSARLSATAIGRDSGTNQVIENCSADVRFTLRRGAAS